MSAGLDLAAVDRIASAAGISSIDEKKRKELLADLEGICSLHRTGVDARYKPAEHKDRLLRITAMAKRLMSLIKKEPWLAHHNAALSRLIDEAERDMPLRLTAVLSIQQTSAFENLVGLLQRTFEKYFNLSAGYTKNDIEETVSGPFIDFAQAALCEMGINKDGIPYARNSIANALTMVRKTKT